MPSPRTDRAETAEPLDDRAKRAKPPVSFVIPARNEADRLPATLRSLSRLETTVPFEVIVVDGGSDDETVAIADAWGATSIEQAGTGVGNARDEGARCARGRWLAFIDADTIVRPTYLDEMLAYVREHDLVGATGKCRVTGPRRAKISEAIMNYVFPHMGQPVLPGFNTFVEREAYFAAGGFPNVPNEDKVFSRELARVGDVDVCRKILVETSGRRIEELGLAGVSWYYFKRDLQALWSEQAGDKQLDRITLVAIGLTVVAGGFQLYHGLFLDHLTATLASIGFFGGLLLFMMDILRPRIVGFGLSFIAVQQALWVFQGMQHGVFGMANSALQLTLAGVLVYGLLQTE